MQSVSKTVTSVIIGAAMQRGDFKAGMDTPVLKYFDTSKVKNVDDSLANIQNCPAPPLPLCTSKPGQ